ncbi:MAG: hypothetical protein V1904_11325 [Bacteroidota bacterium]
MKKRFNIPVSLLCIFLASSLYAQGAKTDTNKWYIPQLIRLQFAGNIGMFSAGSSWIFVRDVIELTPSFGYAPAFITGRDIYIASLKSIFEPKLNISITKKFTFKPFAIGAVFSYTFRDKLNEGQATENYPGVYYWKKIHFRMGLLYQAELYAKLNCKHFSGVGIYLEASWWDVYLVSKFDHGNSSYLNLWDITTFGLGTKIYF